MSLKERALYLYKTAFPEDSDDFANKFINRFFESSCRYLTVEGKIVSMLFLLDCEIKADGKALKGKYLYAAATLPEYRGQGLMAGLIEKAKQETVKKGKYLVTKPATESLFAYYGKFGFKTAVFSEDKLVKKQAEAEPLKKLCREEYTYKREELLKDKPHVTLSDMDHALSFFTLLGDKNTIAAVDTAETLPVVKEFVSEDEKGRDKLLSALNTDGAVFRTEGKTPFAMVIPPNGTEAPKNLHFMLALD